MPIDASIPLQVKQPEMPDMGNQLLKILQIKGLQDQSAMNAIKTQATQRDFDRQNRLDQLLQSGNVDPVALRNSGFLKESLDWEKNAAETGLQRANTTKAAADAEKARVEAAHTRADLVGQVSGWLRQNPTPENAIAVAQHLQSNGVITPEQAQASIAKVQANPTPEAIAQSADMAFRTALQAKDQLPKLTDFAAGDRHVNQAIDPITGKVTETGSTVIGQSADNRATNSTHLQGINIQQAGENSRNRATIAKDYNVAGLNPDGTPGTSNDSMVDAIGQYKVAPPNGMALRNPRMQQILADVTAKYPDFDATQYGARQTAAKAFSTGPQAQQVQSGNTALNHLDTIEQLAAAQKSGNVQLFNKIANTIGTQLGQPAPTNLRAAITMVGPEISKAVIGSGGSAGERDKAEAMLNPNASPDQTLGAVGTIRELFGGRLTETARTYQRSTGRKDFSDAFLSPAAQKVLSARSGSAVSAPAAPALGTVKDGFRFKGGNPADPHSWEKQ